MSAEDHHVIQQQRIKIAVGRAAIKDKQNQPLSDGERRLLETPLSTILRDRRNIVRLPSQARHHRAHSGHERLTEGDLPRLIDEFAADYALEWALEHELQLIRGER